MVSCDVEFRISIRIPAPLWSGEEKLRRGKVSNSRTAAHSVTRAIEYYIRSSFIRMVCAKEGHVEFITHLIQ